MAIMETLQPALSFPEFVGDVTYPDAIRCVGNAAYTLFVTPEHDKLHQDVARIAEAEEPQPLQAPLEETVAQIQSEVLPKANLSVVPRAGGRRLTQLAGVLMQFTDYLPTLHDGALAVQHDTIADLRDGIQKRAKEQGPLGLAEQLDVALEQSGGDVTDAIWKLFIASRQHARWLDGAVIVGGPEYTRDEKVQLMFDWQQSITGLKGREDGLPQDSVGDAYYTWTHALAKVTYNLAPRRASVARRAAVTAFHHGTNMMHTIVHSVNKQGVKSDHSVAAAYGNAIGQACVDTIRARNY